MTVLAIHPPCIELRRDESYSTVDDVKNVPQEDDSFVELELEEVELKEEDENDSSNLAYKSVRFSIQPTLVHDYIHRKDLTPEERMNSWMTPADMNRVRTEIKLTRELLTGGSFVGDNLEFSKRGLETRRRSLVRSTREVVLQEQDRQGMQGIENDMLIFSKYSLANHKAVIVAAQRGKSDFEELIQMYLPDRLAKEEREGYGYYTCSSSSDESDELSYEESE